MASGGELHGREVTPEEEAYFEEAVAFLDPFVAKVGAEQAAKRVAEYEGVLRANGFVRCDAPACNCGGWHQTGGLAARMVEVEEALAEAGYPLSNENGHLVTKALGEALERLAFLEEGLPHY